MEKTAQSISKNNVFVLIDPATTDKSGWEWDMAANVQGYIDTKNLSYDVHQITNIAEIETLFKQNKINQHDIFLYPNAWTPYPIYVKHWAEVYKIKKLHSYGFWSKGCFISEHPIHRPVKNRNWRKSFERAIHRSLNCSFFVNEYYLERFRMIIAKNIHRYRLKIGPFPLDYMQGELLKYNSPIKKDAIVYPWPFYSDLEEKILYDLKRVFDGKIQVIILQEQMNLTREQALAAIGRCKVVMMPFNYPTIGKDFYEMFLLGVIPSVPTIPAIQEFIPDKFSYDKTWTKSIFEYCLHANKYTSYLEDLVVNYDNRKEELDNHVNYLTNTFYNSEKVFNNIFQIEDDLIDYIARVNQHAEPTSWNEEKAEKERLKNNKKDSDNTK